MPNVRRHQQVAEAGEVTATQNRGFAPGAYDFKAITVFVGPDKW
jgi:hypothetical protein